MPELPEVHTTVEGLKKVIIGRKIIDVWSDYYLNTAHSKRQNIKNKSYYNKFKKLAIDSKIISLGRSGKNILINLDNGYTIVVHMKMTGHLMYGKYRKDNRNWQAVKRGPLQDPYNKFIHLVFSLSDKKHLVLSDMRKFASVTISPTKELYLHEALGILGPDPLGPRFNSRKLFEIIHSKGKMPIKSALLDQTAVSGIGNIYSDEILWTAGIHPLSHSDAIPEKKVEGILTAMRAILKFSIKHGGDSKSDYRNAFGEKGGFQNFHKAYGRKKEACPKKNCGGRIERVMIRGRNAHFCPKHQTLYRAKYGKK